MMIEAILAISLFTTAQAMRVFYESQQAEINKGYSFGKKISEITHAIDKRILLDGIMTKDEVTGNWNRSWGTTKLVVDELFGKELVGNANPSCGKADGWSPKIGANNTLALLPCKFLNANKIPFKFDIQAGRSSTTSDVKMIHSWYVRFYHKKKEDFKKYFYLYPKILNKADLYDSMRVSGQHKYLLVDRTNGKEVTYTECYNLGTSCAIEARFETNQMGVSEDVYLRTNGENPMLNSITFQAKTGGLAQCFKLSDTPNASGVYELIQVNCGVEKDPKSGDASLVTKKANATRFTLVNEYYNGMGAPIPITCEAVDGTKRPCGMTIMPTGKSIMAEAYFNQMVVDDLNAKNLVASNSISVQDPASGDNKFKVDANGNVTNSGTVLADQEVRSNAAKNNQIGTVALTASGLEHNNGNASINNASVKLDSTKVTIGGKEAPTWTGDQQQSFTVNNRYKGNNEYLQFATKGYVNDSVQIVGMDVVYTGRGRTTPRRACKSLGGKTPSLKTYAIPVGGTPTMLKSSMDNVCSPNNIDAKFHLDLMYTRDTGYAYIRDINYGYNFSIKKTCALNADYSNVYGVTGSRALKPFFNHVTKKRVTDLNDIPMLIIQYCDYKL